MKKLLKELTIKESAELLELLKEHGLESEDNKELLRQLKKAEYPVSKAVLNKLIQFNFEIIVSKIYLKLVDRELWGWKFDPSADTVLERHISAEKLRHRHAKEIGNILRGFTPEILEHITLLEYPKSKDLAKCTSINVLVNDSLRFVNYLDRIGCQGDKAEVSELIMALEPKTFMGVMESAYDDRYEDEVDDEDDDAIESNCDDDEIVE